MKREGSRQVIDLAHVSATGFETASMAIVAFAHRFIGWTFE
jgi:hypothetical protein